MPKKIGFVSTRLSGTDGVSLEASKWADVFEKNGHSCFWFAGEVDHDPQKRFLIPEAHFQHEQNKWINNRVIGTTKRAPGLTDAIHRLRSRLNVQLHRFIDHFKIDLLIAENVLAIPMHVPLGLALTETIAETQIPTIAHHHDFYWERVRFAVNAVNDYIRMSFPPALPNISHVVINSEAREQLALRTGIASIVIPNVLDFETPPAIEADSARVFRESIGLAPDDLMILQPTRIVQRKGIEHAIELVKALEDPRFKLVISHEAGDEGFEYAEWLKEYACEQGVDLRLVTTRIRDPWANGGRHMAYSLWDVYPYADFITYPSLYEGFGNAFLEAVYFKKPLLINRYATFVRDIEPLGFDLIAMDGFLSKKTITRVRTILQSRPHREQMTEHNYRVAARHYSYAVLRKQLNTIMTDFFGDAITPLGTQPAPPGPSHVRPLPWEIRAQLFNACDLQPNSLTDAA